MNYRESKVSLWCVAIVLGPLMVMNACENPSAVDVWAVGDDVRVDPQNGKVLIQGKTKVHADYPIQSSKRQNTVWNADTRTVTLRSARNEFVAFQIIIDTDEPISEVDISFPYLEHENGRRIEGNTFRSSRNGMWKFAVHRTDLRSVAWRGMVC